MTLQMFQALRRDTLFWTRAVVFDENHPKFSTRTIGYLAKTRLGWTMMKQSIVALAMASSSSGLVLDDYAAVVDDRNAASMACSLCKSVEIGPARKLIRAAAAAATNSQSANHPREDDQHKLAVRRKRR